MKGLRDDSQKGSASQIIPHPMSSMHQVHRVTDVPADSDLKGVRSMGNTGCVKQRRWWRYVSYMGSL